VIVDQIDSKIKAISQKPRSIEREADQRFYSEAAAQFRYFKKWAADAREGFNETEAKRALDHVRDFFESLSLRLS
jgi:hypothetical protein